tara:strand:+ start:4337 stop:4597 length:261 start_codon:yes stop_codon:yes gene_type:complete
MTKITTNMEKARDFHRNKIRERRKSLLEALDIEFLRALETGGDTSTIVSKKNALRNATRTLGIADATNLEELKAEWNVSILGPSPY